MNFRTAFNGFNREDLVHFVEYLNARHTAEINQLKAELDLLRSRANAVQNDDQSRELAAALEENEALKAQIAELQKCCRETPAVPAVSSGTAQELEAYRRAERTERIARERAEQVYHQVNGVLADASGKVDIAATQLGELTDRVSAQLAQLQEAVTGSRQALADASATLYAIRPTGDNS
jgi:hypothetical protein